MKNVGRDKLKETIRKETLSNTARILGISIRTLKRWLEKFNLPNTKTEINSYSDEEWEKI